MRAVALLLAVGVGLAQAQTTPEALALLRKIHHATKTLSYTGIFVYQQGDRTESSRIARIADPGGGIEKLEVLDGVPREIVRTRDTLRCYLPQSHIVKVERNTEPHGFPTLLPERFADLAQYYVITQGESDRIAGFDCQSVVLASRDNLRYSYKLWADAATGMLLKARTLDEKGRVVEQFAFTELRIGPVPRGRVRPSAVARTWRVEEAGATPADLAAAGWTVNADLPGFRKIGELRRRLRESQSVGQVVYSDGLAAVSVFIEPLNGRRESIRPGLSSLGATNIYTREVADHLITVVGEAPAASVRRIADRVEFRQPR